MEDLPERLSTFIKYLGLNNSRFADEINVQRSGISHILSGRNKPGMDFISKILDTYPTLNPDWLIMGRGEMLKKTEAGDITPPEKTLLEKPKPDNDFVEKKPQGVISFSEESIKAVEKSKVRSDKVIERIVIFYKNGTFHTYSPE